MCGSWRSIVDINIKAVHYLPALQAMPGEQVFFSKSGLVSLSVRLVSGAAGGSSAAIDCAEDCTNGFALHGNVACGAPGQPAQAIVHHNVMPPTPGTSS